MRSRRSVDVGANTRQKRKIYSENDMKPGPLLRAIPEVLDFLVRKLPSQNLSQTQITCPVYPLAGGKQSILNISSNSGLSFLMLELGRSRKRRIQQRIYSKE